MEPISTLATALALGAGATAGKEVVSAVVKDAYAKVRDLVTCHYPLVALAPLDQTPEAKGIRALDEDLAATGASHDPQLLAAAHKLIEVLKQQAPGATAGIGVDLKDLVAANLRLAGITASGTGAKLERVTTTGDIEIKDVRAGVSPDRLS